VIKKTWPDPTEWGGYSLEINSVGYVRFYVFVGGVYVWEASTVAHIPLNTWTHIAAVDDGTNLWLYLNGSLKGATPIPEGGLYPSGNDLQIGHDPTSASTYFNGLIDEASVYSTALSAAQIQAIYLAGSAGKCPQLVITAQPRNQTVLSGGTTSFSVAALGRRPLQYQWQLNGTNISTLTNPTATNSVLMLTNAQLGQSGNAYSVVLANASGVTNSQAGILTVLAPGPCVQPPAGLVSWWAAEGSVADYFGTNNGVLIDGVDFAPGEVGQAFNFNGTDQYVDVANNAGLNPTTSLTLEAWVNLRAFAPGASPIIKSASTTNGYSLECGDDGNVRFYAYAAGPNAWVGTPGVPLQLNIWTHVAGVYDGTNIYLYVNGTFAGSASVTGGIVPSGNDLQIGHDPSVPSRYLNGLVDEASIYNTALSAAQILSLYVADSSGKCPGPPVVVAQPQNQTVVAGSTVNFSILATGYQPLSCQWQDNGTNISLAENPTSTSSTLVLTNVQGGQSGNSYSAGVANMAGVTNSQAGVLTVLVPEACVPPTPGLVSWWKADGNANDSFGGNDGTLVDGAGFMNGEVGQAFDLDGASQYVDVPDGPGLDPVTNLTLEAWVYLRAYAPISSPIIKKAGQSGGSADGYSLECGNDGNVRFYIFLTNGSSWVGTSGVPLPLNAWTHVAGVYDGTNLSLYTNGSLAGGLSPGTGSIAPSANDLQIGHDPSDTSRYFNGLIDEASVYSTALSAAQIHAIYAAGSFGKCSASPPLIGSQPQNLFVIAGMTASFTVGAGGSQPLSYQWQVNSTNIPAASNPTATNSKLILTDVPSSLSGNVYSVLVSNAYGSTNSSGAALSVYQPVTHYVAAGNPAPVAPYTSWATAATNIQDAVDAATNADTVLVGNGVYQFGGRGGIRVAIAKTITVQSVDGPFATSIVGFQIPGKTNGYVAVRCASVMNGATLSGFTLTGGATTYNPNPIGSGAGVYCQSSNATVSNCIIVGNQSANSGGGSYSGTLVNCIIANNSAAGGGGGAFDSTLNNCLIVSNSAGYGGGLGSDEYLFPTVLNNCTVYANSATYGGGLYGFRLGAEADFTASNCVVMSNTAPVGSNYVQGGDAYYVLNYCCITPLPSGGLGNITNNPLFVNPAAGDFHLQSNSPCINSGNNAYVSTSIDLDGNPRISGGTVDIGAYEFQNPASIISYAWLQQYGLPTDGSADFTDPDHDGMNNYQEWLTGTDPTNPLSVLELLPPALTNNPPGAIITWQSEPSITYFLQRATNLSVAPAFQPLATNIPGQSGTTSYTDTNAPVPGPYFYRVGVQTQ
jgi:Concanavalin A-like lectin/glucanases superfamily/Immunoglobulin I-set domain